MGYITLTWYPEVDEVDKDSCSSNFKKIEQV